MPSSVAQLSAAMGNSVKIKIRDCRVVRDGRVILDIPELDVIEGCTTVLIGPNGAGKSTLLRALQLLVRPQCGEFFLNDVPMHRDIVATRRRMAVAFQEPLLLNMSVRRNVEIGLRLRGVSKPLRRERSQYWLDRFRVKHLSDRHAHDLSGGEAQRVNLARAFALDPEVLLLDEPFSALDAPTRAGLVEDFTSILTEKRPTTVLVTHDRDEALNIADRVAVIIDGSVHQIGSPADVFNAPSSAEVATFVGFENVWPATFECASAGVATYRVSGQSVDVVATSLVDSAFLCLRPEAITLFAISDAITGSARNCLTGHVAAIHTAGSTPRIHLLLGGGDGFDRIKAVTTVSPTSIDEMGIRVGSPIAAVFKATAAQLVRRY